MVIMWYFLEYREMNARITTNYQFLTLSLNQTTWIKAMECVGWKRQ